jgi:hypothetical protein
MAEAPFRTEQSSKYYWNKWHKALEGKESKPSWMPKSPYLKRMMNDFEQGAHKGFTVGALAGARAAVQEIETSVCSEEMPPHVRWLYIDLDKLQSIKADLGMSHD